MFKSVSIKKFRGIPDISIPDLKRLNLLVGRNNCGKTTILEALFCISNPANPKLPVVINNLRNQIMLSGDDWRTLFHDLNTDEPIQISSEFTSPREKRKLTITPHRRSAVAQTIQSQPGDMIAEQMKGNFSGLETGIIGLDLNSEITEPGQNKDSQKYLASIFSPDSTASVPSMTIPPNYRETLKVAFSTPGQHGALARDFGAAQAEKGIDKVVTVLQEIEPKLKDLKMGLSGQIYADIGLSRLIPITVMGGGFIRLLETVLAISFCRDGILLIDEMEDGFHFSSMDTLWRAIIEASKKYNVQIVATTHSLECVSAFSELCQNNEEDDIRLFRLEKKDDELKAISFNKTALSAVLQNEWEFR